MASLICSVRFPELHFAATTMASTCFKRIGLHRHSLGLMLAAGVASGAQAAPLTVLNTYQLLDRISFNSAGLQPGVRQQFGTTCVVLAGNPCTPQNLANTVGTSGSATQGNVQLAMNFAASDLTSNHWFYNGPAATLPDGAWQLQFVNGGDITNASTPSLAGAQVMGLAAGAALTANSLSPTFTWTLPQLSNGASVDSVSVNIRDISDFRGSVGVGGLGTATIIYSNRGLPGTTTSLTVDPNDGHFLAGFSLKTGHQYALEIQLQDTRTNLPAPGFVQVLSQSRTFVDFMLTGTSLPGPLYLPMADYSTAVPTYRFAGVPVTAGQQVFIDPVVAVGFDYRTQAGDPNFASVTLPAGVGDGQYELWLWDGAQWVDAGQTLTGGQRFSFAAGGVDQFRITGIETSAGLNPVALNFVTGLTFTADGQFNGSMTPLVTSVPEPAPWLMTLAGLAALAARRRALQRAVPA